MTEPAVRVLDTGEDRHPAPPRRGGALLLAAAVLAAAAAGMALAARSSQPAAETEEPPAANTLAARVPGFDRRLVWVARDPAGGGLSVLAWEPEEEHPVALQPDLPSFEVGLDVSGGAVAYLDHDELSERAALLTAWRPELGGQRAPVDLRATSFTWHDTLPHRLAWIHQGRGGHRVMQGDIPRAAGVVAPIEPGMMLTGFGDWGVALTDIFAPGGPVTSVLDRDGDLTATVAGEPAGTVGSRLLFVAGTGPDASAILIDPDDGAPRLLEPVDGTPPPLALSADEAVTAALAAPGGGHNAVVVTRYFNSSYKPRSISVRVVDSTGKEVERIRVPVTSPALAWSDDGRFLVIGTTWLRFYDTVTGETTVLADRFGLVTDLAVGT